jgi:hypothetical protein
LVDFDLLVRRVKQLEEHIANQEARPPPAIASIPPEQAALFHSLDLGNHQSTSLTHALNDAITQGQVVDVDHQPGRLADTDNASRNGYDTEGPSKAPSMTEHNATLELEVMTIMQFAWAVSVADYLWSHQDMVLNRIGNLERTNKRAQGKYSKRSLAISEPDRERLRRSCSSVRCFLPPPFEQTEKGSHR